GGTQRVGVDGPYLARRERQRVAAAVAAGHQVVDLLTGGDVAVPHPVEPTPARRHSPVHVRDRVGQDVTGGHQVVGDRLVEGGESRLRQLVLIDGASPTDVAGVAGLRVGQQRRPSGRGDAVGGHQEVA